MRAIVIRPGTLACRPRRARPVRPRTCLGEHTMIVSRFRLATLAALLGMTAVASAESLTIALASEPTAMDPHYHQATPNNAMAAQVFETLVAQDAKMSLIPNLATSWKTLDDTTWEFKLQEGVKFSN